MIDIDDLPQWLQQVAQRGVARIPDSPNVPAAAEIARPTPPSDSEESAVTDERPLPLHLPKENPLVELRPSGPPEHWWLSDSAVGALFIAIIITIIYVVLVASNVL
jgi:hypothetical protein